MAKRTKKRKWPARCAMAAGLCSLAAFLLPVQALAEATAREFGRVSLRIGVAVTGTAIPGNGRMEEKNVRLPFKATAANALIKTGSNATLLPMPASTYDLRFQGTGELWEGWIGDMRFLDGTAGDGTEERPYQISTKGELMGLSELASLGMVVEEGAGSFPGDYTGAHFELTRDIDLEGIAWMPIGFYRTEEEREAKRATPFCGSFNGNGKTVSNFRMYRPNWTQVGLFGALKGATVTDLTVKPENVITAKGEAGILAGTAENSIIHRVTVSGTLKTEGTAGGVVGILTDKSVAENCTADHVAIDSSTKRETYTGGIVGNASGSLLVDCTVNTGSTKSARIQGGGYVGGIAGFQNDTDIFNVHVMGTIGGAGSQSIGGVSGKYASGRLKVARFEGEIASSGLGSAAHEGSFIGTHDTGFHFRYGTETGADLAYLFTDREEKLAAGVCGCGILEDNQFAYEDHIGFWHVGDNFYTLVQGRGSKPEEGRYFYEELEEGVLHVIDTEDAVKMFLCSPDHFAPSAVGRPVRGYLVSVLQIDTAANVQNYYDVATLTARGSSAYSHDLDKSHRGAVAAGDTVTVTTAPRNTEEEKYQMDGTPTYSDAAGKRIAMSYQTGGSYRFVMPENDTEVSAVYKKVAAKIGTVPEEISFHVVQERSGDRRSPSIVTEVREQSGKLIARYLNGALEEGTEVQEVRIESVIGENNDVADKRTAWSVDDADLIFLKANGDEDASGYTEKSASIELNLEADFFKDIEERLEREQADKEYRYTIPNTIYGGGIQGGVAVLTARTRPAASFEGKPLAANCRILVTFQIKDRTHVAVEGASLDKTALEFTVTRRLTGDRKNPRETVLISPPQTLKAEFSPDYFDKKDVSWTVDDTNLLTVKAGGYGNGEAEADYKNASLHVVKDTKWIRDIMAVDDAVYKENPYTKRTGAGERKAEVTVTAKDTLGNRQTAFCEAVIRFSTIDETEILPERVELNQKALEFDMLLTKTGPAGKPTLTWSGAGGQKLNAAVYPKEAKKKVEWETDTDILSVTDDGLFVPITDAAWITEAIKKYPYTAEQRVQVTARAGQASKTAEVLLKFRLVNKTYSTGSSGGSQGSAAKRSSLGITTSGTTRVLAETPKGAVMGTWVQDGAGNWLFTEGGRTYAKEWAYIHNPYAGAGQESASWFRFDDDGKLHTGWYFDSKGAFWYYLHDKADGSLGRMYKGWHLIGGRWYYFESGGQMATGWRWVDGRCYCLAKPDGYMYSDTVTPDGYTVDGSGAWTLDGVVQTQETTPGKEGI
ncbi:MAG: peptidase A26 [Lachnospiraceae bacterium]|nr:peptidase A26 [Lachnospiraceae bacterium]